MSLIVDIITIMLCSGAIAYCYVLNKQIQSLKQMRDNVGDLIGNMINTTENLQNAFEYTKRSFENDYEKINDKIEEGAALIEFLQLSIQEAQIQKDNVEEIIDVKNDINNVFDSQSDPLENVEPKGLNRPIRKAPAYIIPGEEYI